MTDAPEPLDAWVHLHDHMHRHGTDEPGWREHSHLGGGEPHGHDPETGMQVPVREAHESTMAKLAIKVTQLLDENTGLRERLRRAEAEITARIQQARDAEAELDALRTRND